MSRNVKKKLQYDVLFSCLDVLSRANATVVGSDPKLASDILDAIESLSGALQMADTSEEGKENNSVRNTDLTPSREPQENVGKVTGRSEERHKGNVDHPGVTHLHESVDINRVVSDNGIKVGVSKPVKKCNDVIVGQDDDVIVDVLTNEIVYKYSK